MAHPALRKQHFRVFLNRLEEISRNSVPADHRNVCEGRETEARQTKRSSVLMPSLARIQEAVEAS